MRNVVVVLAALLVAAGPSGPSAAGDRGSGAGPVAFREILVGSFDPHGYDGPADLVIRNKHQWCRFWRRAHATLQSPPPCDPTQVDFRQEVVLASSFAGTNGCVGVRIDRIEWVRKHDALRVFVSDVVPGAGCVCSQSLVRPVRAIVVRKPVGKARFVHETVTNDCGSGGSGAPDLRV